MNDDITLTDIKHNYWRKGILKWKLDSLQERISETIKAKPHAKKICILSSRQIGKSYLNVTDTLEFLLSHTRRIARIIAPTLTSCMDIVNDNLTRITEDAPDGLITRRRSDMRWELNNGSSLRLGALERQHVDSNRGGNADLIVYEEPGFVKGDDFIYGVDSVIGPQLLRSNGREIFVSTPSEDPEHPLHTKIVPECAELGTLFRYTVFDSPSISKQNIIEAMRRSGCKLTDPFSSAVMDGIVTSKNVYEIAITTNAWLSEAFRREYLAEIIRPSSFMVVPDYDERRHVVPYDPPTACFWTVVIDWGGVRDFTVAVLYSHDFVGGKDLIWDEQVFAANTPTNVIVDSLKKWEQIWTFPIHARFADVFTQTLIDMHDVGYDVIPMSGRKGDWLGLVNGLSVKFSSDRILVHPRCTFTRKSLSGGLFNKNRTDFERSAELGHCDGLAAVMYAIKVQNRANPYSYNPVMPDNVFVIEKPKTEDLKFAEALNPKTWDTQRTFGGFRKT